MNLGKLFEDVVKSKIKTTVQAVKLKEKPLKGYKTIVVNVIAIAVIVGAHYGYDFDPGTLEIVVMSVVNLGLRFVTKTPVGG